MGVSQPETMTDPPRRLLEWTALIGLAAVFLVNAVAAVVQPEDFELLIAQSALAGLADAGWLTAFIGLNDLLLGSALVAAIWLTRFRLLALAWAGAWLLVVSAIRLTALA